MSKSNVEQWKNIKEFDNYLVSNQGRVMNAKTGRILKAWESSNGYDYVDLSNQDGVSKKRVGRLVGEAFIENPKNLDTINHKDEDKHNNNADNLEWLSRADNVRYSQSKPVEQYDYKSGRLVCTYSSLSDCSRLTGFSNGVISMACRGQYKQAYGYIWKYQDNNVFTDEDYE